MAAVDHNGAASPVKTLCASKRRRLVVKIGSSTLTTSDSSIDRSYLEALSRQVAELKAEGWDVVIVSSGAIACGLEKLGIRTRPQDMPSLQAAASVGQNALSAAYAECFDEHGIITSLVLLTRRDTADRSAYLHARDTLERLIDLGVVPIVNENDTVSVEQIRFGDNDSLAALVACLIDASLLVILSDIDGLYDANPAQSPEAQLIPLVKRVDRFIMSIAGGTGSVAGSGGMLTKVQAARVMMAAGIPLTIVNGRAEKVIVRCAHGECPGTLFASGETPHTITPKKLWLALGDNAKGTLSVDAGAVAALVSKGSSLLCVGVRSVSGMFNEGDIIDIEDPEGSIIARGRVAASSDEIALACGKASEELSQNRLLRYLATKPIVHRDDLIVFV